MPKKDVTAGERLCTYIRREILRGDLWPQVISSLTPLARGRDLARYFEEVSAVHLTGRLICGGKCLSEQLGPAEEMASTEFEQPYLQFIRETTELTGQRRKEFESRILRLATEAIRAARRDISPSTDKAVREFSQRRHKHCYLCGKNLIFARGDALEMLNDKEREGVFEAEHVWPQSYGGDSDFENLLPACSSCNRKKANFANWSMVDVQSLILGLNPSPENLGGISGPHRFSLLSKAACEAADEEGLTLREAFLKVRHGVTPYVYNAFDVADFFNLRNVHEED
jgi:5-methylcytosine-specific restriction endonuclease McrA